MVQARDVVCGMMVDPDIAHHKSEYKNETYFFCSPRCKTAFDKDPEKYVSQEEEGLG